MLWCLCCFFCIVCVCCCCCAFVLFLLCCCMRFMSALYAFPCTKHIATHSKLLRNIAKTQQIIATRSKTYQNTCCWRRCRHRYRYRLLFLCVLYTFYMCFIYAIRTNTCIKHMKTHINTYKTHEQHITLI